MTTLNQWAAKWGVPYAALYDLQQQFGMHGTGPAAAGIATSESGVQNLVRLEAAKKGARLFRNNVGVLTDDTGRPVRYGLANDSAQMNKAIKSSDLIGIRPVIVSQDMVGSTIGQFVAREIKAPGWRFGGTDREVAQLRFIELVSSMGGDAAFAAGEGTL